MLKRISFCTLAALAIAACAPSGTDQDPEPAKSPFDYEFAYTAPSHQMPSKLN